MLDTLPHPLFVFITCSLEMQFCVSKLFIFWKQRDGQGFLGTHCFPSGEAEFQENRTTALHKKEDEQLGQPLQTFSCAFSQERDSVFRSSSLFVVSFSLQPSDYFSINIVT